MAGVQQPVSGKRGSLVVSQSRRQLFPTNDDDTDELGHIGPLDSIADQNPSKQHSPDHLSFAESTISDYVILENLHQSSGEEETPSPDRSLYHDDNNEMSVNDLDITKSDDTPLKALPMENLRTPQESCHASLNIPRLIRKSSDGVCTNEGNGKRKMPMSSSLMEMKRPKLDQGPKARTALFPKLGSSISSSSFYSKNFGNADVENVHKSNSSPPNSTPRCNGSVPVYLCNRKLKSRKRFGEINAGVRHKIRKPKLKKVIKKIRVRPSKDELAKYPYMNDFLNEIKNLGHTEKQMQDLRPTINEVRMENKENEFCNNNKIKAEMKSHSPNPNNKFFKSKRSVVTVTVNNHTKFKINDGKMCLLGAPSDVTPPKLDTDLSDLTVPENDYLITSNKIDDILSTLDFDKENEMVEITAHKSQPDKITLKAYNSVVLSENSIQLHKPLEDGPLLHDPRDKSSTLLSPTSQMCSMTSVLALNSPIKAKQNITALLNQEMPHHVPPFAPLDMEQKKLFPIFYENKAGAGLPIRNLKATKSTPSPYKKFKSLPKNQMLLDAGQKRFGATQCHECKLVYHMGDPNDEVAHIHYHNAEHVFRFQGWKNERIVARFENARVIRILPSDPKSWLNKVGELLLMVNRELGYYDMVQNNLDNSQVFLCIKGKTIIGCVVAVATTVAHRMLSDSTGVDLYSEESYSVKCGINRIWVSQAHRRHGIATALLNALRGNFTHGYILTKEDMAFSSPTNSGKSLAQKYFGTRNFLVYFS